MAQIPPWLDVTPQAYLGAAESGLRLGEEQQGLTEGKREFNENLGLRRDEMAQQGALQAAEMGQRMMNMKLQLAEFQQRMKQQELNNNITLQQHQLDIQKQQHDQAMQEQQLALKQHVATMTSDWHNAAVANQKERYDEQAKQYADTYAAQQEASSRISNGEDAAQVMLELAPRLRGSLTAMSQFYKDTQPKPDIPAAGPQVMEADGEKFLVNYDDKGVPKYTQIRKQSTTGDDARIKQLSALVKDLRADPFARVEGSQEQKLLNEYQDQLNKALGISLLGPPAQGAGLIRYDRNGNRISGGPTSTAAPAAAPASPGPAANAAAPAHTEEGDQSGNAELPEYMKGYMSDLKYGHGMQSKAAKDLLKDLVNNLTDDELRARAKKYGLMTDTVEPHFYGGDRTNPRSRQELEKEVYDAAIEKGW